MGQTGGLKKTPPMPPPKYGESGGDFFDPLDRQTNNGDTVPASSSNIVYVVGILIVMSVVAVIGATGKQGGSVIRQLLRSTKWKVRGVTRNLDGEKAQSLSREGVEMVYGDVNDESSLLRAFEDATAVFAVTTFWESIPVLGLEGAGEAEVQQYINLAKAAAATSTLHHYILSTLPPASQLSAGKYPVPHFDFKQKGVDWMMANTPDLWAKTTEFWAGAYTSNLAEFPMLRFVPIPGSGNYAFVAPSSPSALFALAGDMETNCGIVVEGILNAGSEAFGKIAICITDYIPFKDVVTEFARVTGKSAVYLEISDDDIAKIWGPFGSELASQLRWGEHYSEWASFSPGRVISLEELNVSDKLVHFRQAMENLKDRLVQI